LEYFGVRQLAAALALASLLAVIWPAGKLAWKRAAAIWYTPRPPQHFCNIGVTSK
jgi:hypothetical protein